MTGLWNEDGFMATAWNSIEENERHKLKEIWVVMLNTGGSEDYISDYCSTEAIANRQLALRKEEQKKSYEGWVDDWIIDGPHEVLTE